MRLRTRAVKWLQEKQVELGYHASLGAIQRFPPVGNNTVEELRRRAFEQSADFFESELRHLSLFGNDAELHAWVNRRLKSTEPLDLILEFGYFTGTSSKRLIEGIDSRTDTALLFAFDAFQGLRDSWSAVGSSLGAFDLGGVPPEAPAGVELVVGWVEETLPAWLAHHPGTVTFAHFDMDVYEPTKFALEQISPRLQQGSLLLFDEFHGYPGWQFHEFRALNEVFSPSDYRFLALGPEQCLIEIL